MLRFLLVFLLAMPVIEIYLLVSLTGMIGFWEVFALVIFTGLLGAEIIRREGIYVLRKLERSVTGSEISRNILEGALLIFSGIFLLTPGLLTDITGFIMVFRPFRERIAVRISEKLKPKAEMEIRTFKF